MIHVEFNPILKPIFRCSFTSRTDLKQFITFLIVHRLVDRSIFSILYCSIDHAIGQKLCRYTYMYIVLHNLLQATSATQ
jgi:hypothetical protein